MILYRKDLSLYIKMIEIFYFGNNNFTNVALHHLIHMHFDIHSRCLHYSRKIIQVKKKMASQDPIFPSYICINWMNHVIVWHLHCSHSSCVFVVWETFDTCKLRIHSCKCVFSIISLPLHLMYLDAQTFSGPNKVFVVREWNVFCRIGTR